MLQSREIPLFKAIIDFARRIFKVFRSPWIVENLISDLLLIKKFLLIKIIFEFVGRKMKMFLKIGNDHYVIANLILIKELLLLKIIMKLVLILEKAFELNLNNSNSFISTKFERMESSFPIFRDILSNLVDRYKLDREASRGGGLFFNMCPDWQPTFH